MSPEVMTMLFSGDARKLAMHNSMRMAQNRNQRLYVGGWRLAISPSQLLLARPVSVVSAGAVMCGLPNLARHGRTR